MADRAEQVAGVRVPDFHGEQALDAWLHGHDIGLLCQGPNPDSAQPLLHGRVIGQRPVPGTTRSPMGRRDALDLAGPRRLCGSPGATSAVAA